jgi:hypothetical protein
MNIESLIESIRKEEVALVIGSGMSIYAGYLGVNELKTLIREKAEQYATDDWETQSLKEKSLEDLSEALVRYERGSRKSLNKILVNTYKKAPQATHTHDLLGRIPHFEHIFTTNYDTLIEGSMERRCIVIGSEQSFPLQNKKLTKVYKLHGDVNNLDGIVITRSDYAKNISGQKENLLWNRFADVIASRDILFIGHGNEDSNFWGVFEYMEEKLKSNQRKRYFIAPSIPLHQQNNLKLKGFEHFLMNADQFLNMLYPKLIEYAVTDLESKTLSSDTFTQFLSLNKRSAIIRSDVEALRVEAIIGPDGDINSEIHFSINKNIFKKYMDFSNGLGRARSFRFAPEDMVDFDFNMSGYRLALNRETLKHFEVLLIHENRKLDIESADGELELPNIPVKQYNFADGSDIELEFSGAKFTFSFMFLVGVVQTKISFNLPESFNTVKDSLDVIGFIFAVFSGKTLNFYFDGGTVIPIQNNCPSGLKFGKWPAEVLIDHFNELRQIEKKIKIRFTTILLEAIDQKTINEVSYIYKILTEGSTETKMEQAFFLPKELRRYGAEHKKSGLEDIFTLILENPSHLEFYGTKLPIFYSIIDILEPEFIRHADYFPVKSRVGKIRQRLFSQEEFERFQNQDSKMVSPMELDGFKKKN